MRMTPCWKYLLLYVIYLIKGVSGQSIEVIPRNTAGLIGETVTIFCKWSGWTPGTGKIRWVHFLNPAGPSTGTIITDDSTINDPSKYGLNGTASAGEFNLQIFSLSESDVGEYACFSQLGSINYYGLYVSLMNITSFETNYGENRAKLSEAFTLICNVTFNSYGNGNWTPSVSIAEGSTPLSVTTLIDGNVVMTTFQISSAMANKQYTCQTQFGAPDKFNGDSSTHIYDERAPVKIGRKTLTITAVHAPVSITFPGKKSLYKVGENVTVYSDAQPPATYVWYRLEGDGPETHSGETLTVTEAMRGNGGNNEYNVSADNLLNSPIYEAISINVEVSVNDGLSGGAIAGIVIGVIVFVVIIIVIIVVALKKTACSRYQNQLLCTSNRDH